MSYRDLLQKQIKELEKKIETAQEDKNELILQLNKLKISEFEEDMRGDSTQKLLLE
jgi:DNA-binding transcriptional MerR regulator